MNLHIYNKLQLKYENINTKLTYKILHKNIWISGYFNTKHVKLYSELTEFIRLTL